MLPGSVLGAQSTSIRLTEPQLAMIRVNRRSRKLTSAQGAYNKLHVNCPHHIRAQYRTRLRPIHLSLVLRPPTGPVLCRRRRTRAGKSIALEASVPALLHNTFVRADDTPLWTLASVGLARMLSCQYMGVSGMDKRARSFAVSRCPERDHRIALLLF